MEILYDEMLNLEEVADLCSVGMGGRQPMPRDTTKFHVSNLLQSARLIAKGDTRYHEYEGEVKGIMSLGRIWETSMDCYLTHYAANLGGFYQPDVESIKDGIIASLDGIMWLPDMGWLVCETKLRFTLNREIPLTHLQQVRAYCHLAETDLVCYVSGHLSSRPPTAEASIRIIRLTEQSIQETWQGILNTKEYLVGQECCPEGVSNGK